MGGDPDELLRTLSDLGLDPANRNGAGQTVAAGPVAALDKLAESPPSGAKVIKLKVAGAFHTRFMAPAEEALRARAETITVADPTRPLLSNADGTVVTGGAEMLRRLIAQVTVPVRWDQCMSTLHERGVTGIIELPPAGTLTGLVKRQLKGTATLAVKTPSDLDKVAALIAEHGTSGGTE
jgi:[acyl-carrier-protein] S-malonyltransferase